MGKIFPRILDAKSQTELTHLAAPNPPFRAGVKRSRSGSTLSKSKPLGRGVEGLTVDQILIKYIVVRTEGIRERGRSWKTKF